MDADSKIAIVSKRQQEEQHVMARRRPWHAPQFIMTDIAVTDSVGGGVSDGSFQS